MSEPGQSDPSEGDAGQEQTDEAISGEVVSADDAATALQLIKQIADLEGRRVGVQEGRNQVALRALEINEKSDQRQFEFHKERLASEERDSKRSHALARSVIFYGGGAAALVLALILGMAFFGNEAQSQLAMAMIEEGVEVMGGAGFIFLVAYGLRKLLRPDR